MNKYTVEFNVTGYYTGAGVWEGLEELTNMECENAQEAIECAIDWMVEMGMQNTENDYDTLRSEIETYAWKAAKETKTKYGLELDNWEFKE